MSRNKILGAVLITALGASGMDKEIQKTFNFNKYKESEKDTETWLKENEKVNASLTQKLPKLTIKTPQPINEDDWREFDEKTDALVPRPPLSLAQPIQPPFTDKLNNLVESLKYRPDGSGYDSDEVQEILKRFEGSKSDKK